MKHDSSLIKESEYDSAKRVLTITFGNGKRFTYKNVPADVYSGLTKAESAGKYFHTHIKTFKAEEVKNG